MSEFANAVPAHGEAHAEEESAADRHDDDVGVCGEEGQRVLLARPVAVGLLVEQLVAVEVSVADQRAVDAVQVVTVKLGRQALFCNTTCLTDVRKAISGGEMKRGSTAACCCCCRSAPDLNDIQIQILYSRQIHKTWVFIVIRHEHYN